MTLTVTRHRALVLTVALIVFSACASVPLKQRATIGMQTAHTAVASAQDAERQFYAAKTIPGLTPQLHLSFSRFFEQYFSAEGRVNTALIAWRAGDPVPADLKSALTDLRDALSAANALTAGADKTTLLGKINAAISEVQRVIGLMGGVA